MTPSLVLQEIAMYRGYEYEVVICEQLCGCDDFVVVLSVREHLQLPTSRRSWCRKLAYSFLKC
jgi:hypothetical protein